MHRAERSCAFVVGGGRVHGVTPERLVDTRTSTAVPAGCWLRLQVPASVPVGADSLVLTVTSDQALSAGFLRVHSCGSSLPELSNVNVRPEGPTSNLVMVAIDATRETCIFTSGGTDVIVDLIGWFGAGGSQFQEFAPRRAVDTRQPTLRPPGVAGKPAVNQQVEIPPRRARRARRGDRSRRQPHRHAGERLRLPHGIPVRWRDADHVERELRRGCRPSQHGDHGARPARLAVRAVVGVGCPRDRRRQRLAGW